MRAAEAGQKTTSGSHSETTVPTPPMRWNGWGDPQAATTLSEGITALLRSALGITGAPRPVAALGDIRLAPTRLAGRDLRDLADLVGADHVSADDHDRLLRAGGKSTLDLLRRGAVEQDAPDAVVVPGTDDEVAAVLRWCEGTRVAVVAFGGGTSVVGGLDPLGVDPTGVGLRAVISLDLHRFDTLVEIDEVSGIAVLGAGVTGPRAEELLGVHGFSLGHFPQSFQFATIGGFAVTRSSGQSSAGYGRFDDMVVGLTAVTPRGTLRLGDVAKSAAGPDLRQLVLGSEGTLGIVTTVALRVHRTPTAAINEAWHFDDFAAGVAALRAVSQGGPGLGPTVLRLSDEAETGVNLAMPGAIGSGDAPGGCLAITRYEGDDAACAARRELTAAVLATAGGTSLGADAADAWELDRFSAPYLRDALLAVGVGCETLETATTWSRIADLRAALVAALTDDLARTGSPAIVLCHISHTYPTGASLYFTVVYRLSDEPIAQWTSAKAAAGEAIVRHSATITHHHAVGTDHRDWLGAEIGTVGVEILRAVKQTLDPAGILNPGKLIP